MPDRRSYSSGTRSALFSLSRGTCYAPACGEPVVRYVAGTYITHVEIAHIIPFDPNGPRGEEGPIPDVDAFENLVLLCREHHTIVDGRSTWRKYPGSLLRNWKQEREATLESSFSELRGLSLEEVRDLLSTNVDEVKAQITSGFERTSEQHEGLRQMLETLINDSFDRPYIDRDAVEELSTSAWTLRNLGDDSQVLLHAATSLRSLEENAAVLLQASRLLEDIRVVELVDRLHESRIGAIAEGIERLTDRVGEVNPAPSRAVDRGGYEDDYDDYDEFERTDRLGSFGRGVVAGFVLATVLSVVILILVLTLR